MIFAMNDSYCVRFVGDIISNQSLAPELIDKSLNRYNIVL